MKNKDKQGVENLTVDHLSHLEDPNRSALKEKDINDAFPEKYVYSIPVVRKKNHLDLLTLQIT